MDGRILNKGARHSAAWIGLLVALGVGLVFVLRILAPFMSVILLAVVAAGMLFPVYRALVMWFGGRRHWAALVICLLLLVALLLPLFFTAREVSKEAIAFYEMSTTQITEQNLLGAIEQQQKLLDRINGLMAPVGVEFTAQDIYQQAATLGVRIGGIFYKGGVSLATGLLRFVLSFLVWVIVLYYLLIDGDRLREWFRHTLPLPANEQNTISRRFMDMASSLVIGNGIAATVQAMIGGAVFAILGLPGPALWGVVMWVFAFIPVIGISLVYIPVWIILMLLGETGKAFAMLIPLMITATIVEYWLKPMLVGRRAQLHTLLVFLSLLGGLEAFGAVGLLLGPLMMTAFLTVVSIYQEHYRPSLPTVHAGIKDPDPYLDPPPL